MQPTAALPHPSWRAALVLNEARLNELSKAHNISNDADLARVIGVNPSTLFRVRTGEVMPSNEFMAKVGFAFPSVDTRELFRLAKVPVHQRPAGTVR